ncbi:MAG TPA: hypothetical protein VNB49_14035 [Candidatus Dormibacteraeota bacterium]|nr:hypothetical protein [Candidatus Dormibacteraeota bacterium]
MSWASEAVSAIRKIVLIEDRMDRLTEEVRHVADSYLDVDRRLLRLEAKFELIERLGGARRKALPARTRQRGGSKKVD